MNQKDLHEKILYPVTRVKAGKAGGSGVLVYSEPDPEDSGKYINIILTCQHVIDGAISVKDEWDSLLKREIKKDIKEEVANEVFDYDGYDFWINFAEKGSKNPPHQHQGALSGVIYIKNTKNDDLRGFMWKNWMLIELKIDEDLSPHEFKVFSKRRKKDRNNE